MSNDDKPSNWVEQIGEKVAANNDIDKQHGRALGKLESAATSKQSENTALNSREDNLDSKSKEVQIDNEQRSRDGQQKYDQAAHEKKVIEAELERDQKAIKDYDNRMTKTTLPEPEKAGKNILSKMDDLIDKATPYVDDLAKELPAAGRLLGGIVGVAGFFYPDSTVDEETEQKALREWEERHYIPIDPLAENSTDKGIVIENEVPPIDLPTQGAFQEEPIDLTDVPEVQNLFNQLDEITTEQDIPYSIESLDLDVVDYEDMEGGMDMDFD